MRYKRPIIGIFTKLFSNPIKPFGEQTSFFQECMEAGKHLGVLVYVFTPDDILWDRRIVVGRIFRKDSWIKKEFPFPDVVYDRGFFNEAELEKKAIETRERLQKNQIIFLNPLSSSEYVNDKMKSYSLLSNEGIPVPITKLLNKFSEIDIFFEKEELLFLKPKRGSQGKGIIRLKKSQTNKEVYINYGFLVERVPKKMLSGRLFSILKNYGWPTISYVIQQGIKTVLFNGHVFDLRTIVQKNSCGKWSFTGVATRVAVHNCIVPNIHSGGRAEPIEKVLPAVALKVNINTQKILQEIKSLSLRSAIVIEKQGAKYAEIAVDLVIDRHGKLWVIELNSKPGRNVFKRISLDPNTSRQLRNKYQKIRKNSIFKPIAYAKYISSNRIYFSNL